MGTPPTNDVVVIKRHKEMIKEMCKLRSMAFYSVMTALGDSYRKMWEPYLLALGFTALYHYGNLHHGTGYKQTIYKLDVKDL